jgi:DNA-binding transcriptional regulator of glucitol operon
VNDKRSERKVWSDRTTRSVTWIVVLFVAALIVIYALAWWRLRG